MTPVNQKIAELVRTYRLKAKMTQLQLAGKLDYETPQFVSLIERGVSKVPVETLGKLTVILNIPESKFLSILTAEYKQTLMGKFNSGRDLVKGKV